MGTRKEQMDLVVSAKDRAKRVLGGIQKQIVGIGAAYMSWRAVAGTIGDIVAAGRQYEKAWNDISASLKRHGMVVDENLKKIQHFSGEMQTMSGESDEVIGKMVQGFLDYGQTVEEAMDTTKVAMDLAAGAGMDMKAATDLLAKAAVGYTGTLSRYGIIIDENIPKSEKFAAAIQQINERFGGSAQARMDTVDVKLKVLSQTFGDLEEAIFVTANKSGVFNDVLESMTALVAGLAKEIKGENIVSFWDKMWAQMVFIATGNTQLIVDNFKKEFGKEGGIPLPLDDEDWLEMTAGMEGVKTEYAMLTGDMSEKAAALSAAQNQYLEEYTHGYRVMREDIEGMDAEYEGQMADRQGRIGEYYVEAFGVSGDAADNFVQRTNASNDRFTAQLGAQTGRFASDFVGILSGTEKDASKIFKRIAADFMNFFVKKALLAITGPGGFVASFLSSLKLFDVAANDRMAMRQGQDFAKYFTQGMLGTMGNVGPAMAGAAGGGLTGSMGGGQASLNNGAIINNYYFTGPVTDVDWIKDTVAPIIEEASAGGKSLISIDRQNITGEPEVAFI